ncbi:MAG: single-stranded DNA-binding protein [Acidobacteria bacterium]|nr:single-stranded DNA-binding protein [Acidobacteriota bacterium]
MRSINKVILIGNVGKAPVVRRTQDGRAVANFSVATSETFADRQQQQQERTEWHNIVAFGKLGDICEKYVTKGKQIYLEGRLQTRKWTDKEGKDRYTTEIVAQNMMLLGRRDDAGQPAAVATRSDATPSFPDTQYDSYVPPEEEDTPF